MCRACAPAGSRSCGHPTDLYSVCTSVAESWNAAAHQAQVVLEATAMIRSFANVDGDRIHQVLDNLVGNAVKYADPMADHGPAWTPTTRRSGGSQRGSGSVSDVGPGISLTGPGGGLYALLPGPERDAERRPGPWASVCTSAANWSRNMAGRSRWRNPMPAARHSSSTCPSKRPQPRDKLPGLPWAVRR